MLKELRISNFTAFVEADLRFCDGLNVLVGENGVGKTHLLKLPYAVLAALAEQGRNGERRPTKSLLNRVIAEKLVNVMRPEALGRLARWQPGRQRCEVSLTWNGGGDPDMAFNFATQSKSEVVSSRVPSAWPPNMPVFLPTRELLSIYPGFSALYDTRHLEFEETWRDTCQLLGSPTLRGPRRTDVQSVLEPLERLMGGRLVLDRNGRFYLRSRERNVEMPLVAEGVRKLAMLARLVATDSLPAHTALFWDEPETNLNPKLMKGVAAAIMLLAARGVQVVVATHSLFFLREIEVLRGARYYGGAPCRYFAMALPEETNAGQADGRGVDVEQGDNLEDIEPLVLLDEDLEQSDRYLGLGL